MVPEGEACLRGKRRERGMTSRKRRKHSGVVPPEDSKNTSEEGKKGEVSARQDKG